MDTQEYPSTTTTPRVEALRRELLKATKTKSSHTVEIVFWEEGPWGLRIAEISFVEKRRSAGFSYMRGDPPAAAIVLFAEEYLIEEDDQERENVLFRLLWTLKSNAGEGEGR